VVDRQRRERPLNNPSVTSQLITTTPTRVVVGCGKVYIATNGYGSVSFKVGDASLDTSDPLTQTLPGMFLDTVLEFKADGELYLARNFGSSSVTITRWF
jgi:hypothetical protein